ncbi:MAG: MBL fold metallo-hydrolase [Anaerolineae bacterium]|jgi:glyoxylase-like metal-dependent hydrolase (beta-lactamase superfamily II)
MTDDSTPTVEWFKTRYIGNATWAIDDRGCGVAYLVAGKERCLLMDTGWGIGDLPGLVASLSSLPLSVVNTHGHPDHTFGNGQFEQIYLVKEPWPGFGKPLPIERRRWIVENILPKPLPPDFDLNTWAASSPRSLTPIQDGHTFDLGERCLEVISTPGHSPGSICLLDRQARYLFTGDSVLPGTVWLHLNESLPLSQFCENLKRLQGLADQFDYVLPAHAELSELPLSKSLLDDLVNGIELILAGALVGEEEETFAGTGLNCDFGSCSVLYRPDRL